MSSAFKFPTVSKFLCYFDLTTGGFVLAGIDAVIYGVTFLALVFNMLTGMSLVDSKTLNEFSILGFVIDEVAQLVVLLFFFLMAAAFLSGVKDKVPQRCLPYIILIGIQTAVSLMEGLVFLKIGWISVSIIKCYFFIVIYSLYKLLNYGDEQEAYQAHHNANSAGYEQFYEPEGLTNVENNETGYQTTEFKGP